MKRESYIEKVTGGLAGQTEALRAGIKTAFEKWYSIHGIPLGIGSSRHNPCLIRGMNKTVSIERTSEDYARFSADMARIAPDGLRYDGIMMGLHQFTEYDRTSASYGATFYLNTTDPVELSRRREEVRVKFENGAKK